MVFSAIFRFASSFREDKVCLIRHLILITQDVAYVFAFIRRASRLNGRNFLRAMINRFNFGIIFQRLECQGARLITSMSPRDLRRFIVRLVLLIFYRRLADRFRATNDRLINFLNLRLHRINVFGNFLTVGRYGSGRRRRQGRMTRMVSRNTRRGISLQAG